MTLLTAPCTSSGDPFENQMACGTAAMAVMAAASLGAFDLARAAICSTAPGLGGGTNRRAPCGKVRRMLVAGRLLVRKRIPAPALPNRKAASPSPSHHRRRGFAAG